MTRSLTKKQLVRDISSAFEMTLVDAEAVLDWAFAQIGSSLATGCLGASFSWPGFGTWTRTTRKARNIRNPATKEIMRLRPQKSIHFRASKALKARL